MAALAPVRLTRTIDAPASEIFELLAAPGRHAEIDGSGSVRGVQPGTPTRLGPGARFGMQMRIGAPYKILNQVIEFEEGRRIAWRHFSGHVWRWTLRPVDGGRTEVTEEYDPRPARWPLVLRLIRAETTNRRSIEATLDRLAAWADAR